MRRILLLYLSLLVNLSVSSQTKDSLVYQTITDFCLDTTAFLRYNFVERADCYKGMKFRKLYEELNMKPIMMGVGYTFDDNGQRLFSGIRLYIGFFDNVNRYVQIAWKEPQPMPREAELLIRKNGPYSWLEQYALLFADNVISSVYTDESITRYIRE